LSLMLLLDDSPIIIDQPEEDLDTKRITDLVVTNMRQFKKKQQVIVVTHNPNIPVNGGAENIIQMNFAGGQIQKHISGALQKTEVREAVCEVMEGGKEALDKRYFRISKALEQ
jgi:ABC-type lipoprotein export system ATPase subunit